MALAVGQAVTAKRSSTKEQIIDFYPERLKASFFLRCAALSIDYIILLAAPLLWLVMSEMLDEHGTASISIPAWLIVLVLFAADFILFPVMRGQTIGKKICGLTIVNMDGTDVRTGTVLIRNVAGYLLTVLTMGSGFLISAVNSSGRSLHDLIAGTIVVRGSRKQV